MSKEAVRYLYVAFTQPARLDVAIVSRSTWRIIPSAINRIRSLAWSMSIECPERVSSYKLILYASAWAGPGGCVAF